MQNPPPAQQEVCHKHKNHHSCCRCCWFCSHIFSLKMTQSLSSNVCRKQSSPAAAAAAAAVFMPGLQAYILLISPLLHQEQHRDPREGRNWLTKWRKKDSALRSLILLLFFLLCCFLHASSCSSRPRVLPYMCPPLVRIAQDDCGCGVQARKTNERTKESKQERKKERAERTTDRTSLLSRTTSLLESDSSSAAASSSSRRRQEVFDCGGKGTGRRTKKQETTNSVC